MVWSWPGAQEVSGSSPSSLETTPTHTHTHTHTLAFMHYYRTCIRPPLTCALSAPSFVLFLCIRLHTVTHSPSRMLTYINPHKIKYFNPPPMWAHIPAVPHAAQLWIGPGFIVSQYSKQSLAPLLSVLSLRLMSWVGATLNPALASPPSSTVCPPPPTSLFLFPVCLFLRLSPCPSCTGALKEFAWKIWLQSVCAGCWMLCARMHRSKLLLSVNGFCQQQRDETGREGE